GVELFNSVQVERIVCEGGRVRGVLCGGLMEGGETLEPRFLEADAVLSNANLHTTALRLVGDEHLDTSFAEGLRKVRLNNSSTQVYMGIRDGMTLPWVTDLLFCSTREEFDSPALCDMRGESRTFSFYYPKTRPGTDRYTVVSSQNANFEDWQKLSQEDYESEKSWLAEKTLAVLEGYVPGVREMIDHVEVATPRTFEFYTQHSRGASFGTKFEGLPYSMTLSEQVAGLYHAGSVGIIMSGWLGAANYGVITANKVDAFLRDRAQEEQAALTSS
ncbi:MAG: phytoene dehydrogenase, partial [Planctomycetota bacterium]